MCMRSQGPPAWGSEQLPLPKAQGSSAADDNRPKKWKLLKTAVSKKDVQANDLDSKALYKNMKQSYIKHESMKNVRNNALDFTDAGFVMGLIGRCTQLYYLLPSDNDTSCILQCTIDDIMLQTMCDVLC